VERVTSAPRARMGVAELPFLTGEGTIYKAAGDRGSCCCTCRQKRGAVRRSQGWVFWEAPAC